MEFAWVGLVLMLVLSRLNYKILTNKWTVPIMYVVNLILLVAVMVKGHAAQGAQRWLALGPITLQPSEIAKLVVIFTLSAWLSTRPIRSFFDIFKVLAIILPPAVLVFKQPDLGTSLTFGAVFFGMTFWAGATICDVLALTSPLISLILNAVNPLWWLYFIGALGLVLLIFWRRSNWNFWIRLLMVLIICGGNYAAGEMRPHMWGLFKEYQQKRLTSFVNPYDDPRGSGYHILQSLIAIGSGGPEGAGLGKGNQSQGAFIPERHTDFIFAVVGEEWGFKFTALVVFAYGIICTSRFDDRPPAPRRTSRKPYGPWSYVHVSLPRLSQYRHGDWDYACCRCSLALLKLRRNGTACGYVIDWLFAFDKTTESTRTKGRMDGLTFA